MYAVNIMENVLSSDVNVSTIFYFFPLSNKFRVSQIKIEIKKIQLVQELNINDY